MGARTAAEEESPGQVSVSRPASECSMEGDLKARVCPEKPGTEQLSCSGGDLSLEVGTASSEVAQSITCVLVFTLAFQSCAGQCPGSTASAQRDRPGPQNVCQVPRVDIGKETHFGAGETARRQTEPHPCWPWEHPWA